MDIISPLIAVGLHLGLDTSAQALLYLGMFVAFFASIFWRPTIGIYLLAFTLPAQTVRYRLHVYPLGAEFLDILILGTVLGLVVRKQSLIPKSPINRILLILAIFYYVSMWMGAFFLSAPLPWFFTDDRFSDWKNYVEMFMFAPLVAAAFKEKREIYILIIIMCFSVLAINRSYISLISSRDFSHFSYEARDSGALGYAGENGFAAFESMFASFLLGVCVYQKRILVKLAILGVVATNIYCLLFSFSRGGYIGLMVGVLTIGLLKARHYIVLLVIVLFAWQFLLPTSVQERITMTTQGTVAGQQFDSSSEERVTLWQGALELFERNPVTGTGFDTYQFMGTGGPYRDTHNYFMKVLAETGIVGLFLYLFLLKKLLRVGRKLFRAGGDRFWNALSLGFIACVTSSIAMNFFGDRWTYQQVGGYLWILLGCIIRGLLTVEERASTSVPEAFELTANEVPAIVA